MKIPIYDSGGVQQMRGVDPGVYRELGRAQANFANAIGQGAEVATQHYKRVSAASYSSSVSKIRNKHSELKEQFRQNPYTDVSSLPTELQGKYQTETITEQIEGQDVTREVVRTDQVAPELYRFEMDKLARAEGENSRTRLARDELQLKYNNELSPKGDLDIASFAHDQGLVYERAEWQDQAQGYVDNYDDAGYVEHLQMGLIQGTITEKERQHLQRSGLREININSYTRDINSIDTNPEILRNMVQAIEGDKNLEESDRIKLVPQAQARWNRENANFVGEATAERDIPELHRLRDLYSADQGDGPHPSGLDGKTRAALIGSIDSALKAIIDGDKAGENATRAFAQHTIDNITASVRGNGNVDLMRSESQLRALMDVAYPPGGTVSDEKKRLKIEELLSDIPYLRDIAIGGYEDMPQVVARINELRTKGTISEAQADRLDDYLETAEEDKQNNTAAMAERHGIIQPVDYNPDDITGSLRAEFEANAMATEHYGVRQRTARDEFAADVSRQFDEAGPTEKAAIIQQVSDAYGGDYTAIEDFWIKRVGDKSPRAALGILAANSDIKALYDAIEGNRLRSTAEGKALLTERGLDAPTLASEQSKLAARLHDQYSITSGSKVEVIMDLTAKRVADGIPVGRALQDSTRDVLGANLVKGTATGHKVVAPGPTVTQTQFRKGQQRIPEQYYKDIGWTGKENLRNLITSGDVEFRTSEEGPAMYELYDVREGTWLRAGGPDGDILVVDWHEAMTYESAGTRGRLQRFIEYSGMDQPGRGRMTSTNR